MFNEISYYLVFGKPLILYLGITTLILFLSVVIVGFLIYTRKTNIEFKWHIRLAALAIIMALIHGFFGIAAYL